MYEDEVHTRRRDTENVAKELRATRHSEIPVGPLVGNETHRLDLKGGCGKILY